MLMFKTSIHTFCSSYLCNKRASYMVGHPNTLMNCISVCEDCAKNIVSNLPDELVPIDGAVMERAKQAIDGEMQEALALIGQLQTENKELQKKIVEYQSANLAIDDAKKPMESVNEVNGVFSDPNTSWSDVADSMPITEPDEPDAAEDAAAEDAEEEEASSVAADEGDYICLDCNKAFRTRATLTRHRNSAHKE